MISSGTRLGPYEILSPIGAGGMGEVYKARDTRLGRAVAVKILPAEFGANARLKTRFEREAKTISHLNHPNICAVHDVGSDSGLDYIVMEYLDGETLADRIAKGPLSLPDIFKFGAQIAEALGSAHRAGIVHRDLKPGNIMLTKSGVKLLDFGLAKTTERVAFDSGAMTENAPLTEEGRVVGTIHYMAPEQLDAGHVDARTDIFALGSVLYEMTTCQRPFGGPTLSSVVTAIATLDPAPLATKRPETPPELDHIIGKCLKKDPDNRWQNAADVAEELRWVGEIRSRPSIVVQRRNRTPPIMVAVIALIAVAVTISAFVASRVAIRAASSSLPPVIQEPRQTFTQLTFRSALAVFPSLSPDGKSVVFASDQEGRSAIYLQRVGGQTQIKLSKGPQYSDTEPAFSPDGAYIAFRSDRNGGGIFAMGATGESVRRLSDFGYNPSWSPDGTEIVFCSADVELSPAATSGDGNLWIVNVSTGNKRLLTKHLALQPSWSPHGQRVAFWSIGEDGQRDLWTIAPNDPNPDNTIVRVTNDRPLDWNPVWSPDGGYLYWGSDRDGTMNLWRIPIDEKSGKPRGAPAAVTVPASFAAHFTTSRIGNEIAFASVQRAYALERFPFNPTTANITGNPALVLGGSFYFTVFSVSPDGKQIAFGSRGGQEDIFVVNVDGTDLRQLTNDVERDRVPSWSPDSKRLYFYSVRGTPGWETWSIGVDGSGLTQVTKTSPSIGYLWFPRASPDGRSLVLFNNTGSYIWRLQESKYERIPPIDDQHVLTATSWSPDGQWLVGLSSSLRSAGEVDGVVLFSLRTKRFTRLDEDSPDLLFGEPAWLPNGRQIVYPLRDHVVIVDTVTKRRHEISPAIPGLSNLAVSPDGRSLYARIVKTTGEIWVVKQEPGANAQRWR